MYDKVSFRLQELAKRGGGREPRSLPRHETYRRFLPTIMDEGGERRAVRGVEGASRSTARSTRVGDPLARLAGLRRAARTRARRRDRIGGNCTRKPQTGRQERLQLSSFRQAISGVSSSISRCADGTAAMLICPRTPYCYISARSHEPECPWHRAQLFEHGLSRRSHHLPDSETRGLNPALSLLAPESVPPGPSPQSSGHRYRTSVLARYLALRPPKDSR